MSDTHKVRYCRNRKCHCELMSTNKKGICEDCRRKRNNIIGSVIGVCGGMAGIVLPVVKKVLSNKK